MTSDVAFLTGCGLSLRFRAASGYRCAHGFVSCRYPGLHSVAPPALRRTGMSALHEQCNPLVFASVESTPESVSAAAVLDKLRARFLRPLVKARAFGMTSAVAFLTGCGLSSHFVPLADTLRPCVAWAGFLALPGANAPGCILSRPFDSACHFVTRSAQGRLFGAEADRNVRPTRAVQSVGICVRGIPPESVSAAAVLDKPRARFLRPLVKARAFGMTSLDEGAHDDSN